MFVESKIKTKLLRQMGEAIKDFGMIAPGDRVMVSPGTSCGRCAQCLSGEDSSCRHYRIFGHQIPGGYAELVRVPFANLIPLPGHLPFEEAAAFPLVFLTAWRMLVGRARVRMGEDVLVWAAGSGVGMAAIQVAKLHGARVIATAGTEEKAQLARDAGADECIVYTQTDFETETRRLTEDKGVHVVYDGVGKATFEKDLNVLRPRGYLVLFGGASGAVPPFDLIKLSQKGSLYITRPTLGHYTATREELEWRANEVLQMIAGGDLKLRIHKVYPLTQAEQAHRDLEGRKTTGKLLLKP
jgi:NADPH2:quinone reductase